MISDFDSERRRQNQDNGWADWAPSGADGQFSAEEVAELRAAASTKEQRSQLYASVDGTGIGMGPILWQWAPGVGVDIEKGWAELRSVLVEHFKYAYNHGKALWVPSLGS
jgi:uncharacterized protein YecA (UPF0149 family)